MNLHRSVNKSNTKSCTYFLLTYNQEGTVRDSVLSALAQECRPLEILISDDCSTDETFRVIQDTVDGYNGPHRVVLNRNKENLGVNAHLQLVHELSSGSLLIAASGDDISVPHRSARILEKFEREAPLLIHSHALPIFRNGQRAEFDYSGATFFRSTNPLDVASSTSVYLGATAAWDKDLYKRYGPVEDYAYEDLVFGFRASLEGRVGFIDEKLVIYRLGGGVTSLDQSQFGLEDYRKFWERGYRAHAAVFRQRRRDARTFGLRKNDKIVRAIDAALLTANLNWAYFRGGPRAVWAAGFWHPSMARQTIRAHREAEQAKFGTG